MIPLHDPDLVRRTTPYVTRLLIALNVLVGFVTLLAMTDLDEIATVYRYGVIPRELTSDERFSSLLVTRLSPPLDIASPVPTWATMFTAMFLHGGLLHLASNMLFLWVFGDNVEDRFGHLRFLVLYLAAGVAAVWAQVGVEPSSETPMIGASGAVAGVLGAYIVLYPRSRVDTLVIVGFIFHLRLPAFALLGSWALLQLFSGLGSLGISSTGSGIAYFAHLGGFAAGGAAAGALVMLRGRHRPSGGRPSGPANGIRWRP